jgi:hypothetical protein
LSIISILKNIISETGPISIPICKEQGSVYSILSNLPVRLGALQYSSHLRMEIDPVFKTLRSLKIQAGQTNNRNPVILCDLKCLIGEIEVLVRGPKKLNMALGVTNYTFLRNSILLYEGH